LDIWFKKEMKTAEDKGNEGLNHYVGLDTEGNKDGNANYVQIAGPLSPSISVPSCI
jgi:hypothetical protein